MKQPLLFGIIGLLLGVSLTLGFVYVTRPDVSLGGSTSDDWNVGGDLTISGTGTSTFAGNVTTSGDLVVNNVIKSGNIASTSSEGAGGGAADGSLTAAQVCDNNVFNSNVLTSFTLTTPTSVSFAADCLDTLGKSTEFIIYNNNASSQTITMAAGAGVVFKIASASETTSVVISEEESMKIEFINMTSSSVIANFIEFR